MDTFPLFTKLKDLKQKVFNEMVEGNGRQPAEVVDMVIYVLNETFPPYQKEWYSILDFNPDYVPSGERAPRISTSKEN